MGDSLSQGIGPDNFEQAAFPARLTEKWKAKGCKVELKNAGISGYTVAQIIQDELPEIAAFKPTLITFQSGSNDIANGVTPDEYRKNVKKVLETAKKSGARVVVLLQNEWFRAPRGPDYGGTAEKRNAYDAIMIEEAKAKGAEIADLRPIYKAQADKKMWVSDGIHPPAKAYEEWANELVRVVPVPCAK
jgi:acyl-CoA thioesterase I